uniref:PHD-type domain-containing protein n=1 Tax=Hippocampus comes TaxID=109280 RepID=A0A3Q2YII3_HIPCM
MTLCLMDKGEGSLICCLCGLPANAMDLGDLHGPYYPKGYRVSNPKTSTPTSGPKGDKEDDSDSDSSSFSVGGGARKRSVPPSSWSHRPANQWWQKGLSPSRQRAADNSGSPAAKRACSEMWPTDVEDWYSPPVLPMEPREYWLHEDCAIWSAGIFLVKGRVYGLEESVKVAQETMCSACSAAGATLGCFFKGCPSKYHYRCALEADCVLIEENFSMKCKKHKVSAKTIFPSAVLFPGVSLATLRFASNFPSHSRTTKIMPKSGSDLNDCLCLTCWVVLFCYDFKMAPREWLPLQQLLYFLFFDFLPFITLLL